jgi:methyl-accepting chemotaxis protein
VEYVMGQLAAGDLSIKLEPEDLPERYQALGTSFNATVKALSLVILDVEKGAQGLLVSAEALAESARVGADRAKQQSESVEESAAAMNQLTSGVEATTALASEADAMMTANQKEAEIGGSVLEQAVAAMQRIEESSNQISRISAVMEDIAFQTNLLALNAGVEAARAGELGRGFAVVASAVRELSQRAGDATKEIRTLVSDSRKNVAKGAELVGKTSESLGALIKGAGKTAVIVSDIATKMREQTRGLGALSNNIMVLEMTAQAGTQVANQSSAMGHQLREQASAMIGSVTAFRSGQVGGVHSAAIAAE